VRRPSPDALSCMRDLARGDSYSFQHVYSMLARFAAKANPRLRLLPPYREYVSQGCTGAIGFDVIVT